MCLKINASVVRNKFLSSGAIRAAILSCLGKAFREGSHLRRATRGPSCCGFAPDCRKRDIVAPLLRYLLLRSARAWNFSSPVRVARLGPAPPSADICQKTDIIAHSAKLRLPSRSNFYSQANHVASRLSRCKWPPLRASSDSTFGRCLFDANYRSLLSQLLLQCVEGYACASDAARSSRNTFGVSGS